MPPKSVNPYKEVGFVPMPGMYAGSEAWGCWYWEQALRCEALGRVEASNRSYLRAAAAFGRV